MNPVVACQKPIVLEGVCNFRDLGGFKAADGRTVRYGKIFRSDKLSHLTDADLRHLQSLSLATIVDLRVEWEIKRCPDKKPDSVKNMIVCSIDTPRLLISAAKLNGEQMLHQVDEHARKMLGDTDAKISTLPPEQIRASVIELYEMFVVEPECLDVYKRIFALLLQDSTPLLFHCMAGKDRTGIVAALILTSLGVDENAILKDYLISNIVVEKKYAKHIALGSSLRFLFEAREEYLSAALAKIREKHGTVECYLSEVLGVDTDEMKNIYLK